jgi:ribulose-phosphate 3-epimerase
MKAGVALNPHTGVASLSHIISDIDLVCLMSVNPGFGGQSFIDATYEKVRELRTLIEENKASTLIEIDGGVTDQNASQLVAAGADVLVAGSYVFSASDPTATIANLSAQVNS